VIAEIERREYTNGRPFWQVYCRACLVVLNSGHHYDEAHLPHAQALADEHNLRCH
jgi:hypothetical protein